MNFGCWNVQGWNNKEQQVIKEIKNLSIDIAAVSETKKKGNGNEYKGDYILFYSGVAKEKRAKAGIGILIHKKYRRAIKDWNPVNERILTVEMTLKNRPLTVIGVYAPNEDTDVGLKNLFYDELSAEIEKIKKQNEILIMGDFNGRVGKRRNCKIIGRYGEDTENDNGHRLTDICEEFSMKILNGHFQHKDIHTYTWTRPTLGQKSIIDYIISKQESSMQPLDVRVFRGAECGSDHLFVKGKFYFAYRNKKNAASEEEDRGSKITETMYNLGSLKDEGTTFLYKLRLAQKLKLFKDGSANDMYEELKERVKEAAQEALGTKQKTKCQKNQFWWNEDIEELTQEKKSLYERWLNTQDVEDRKEYNRFRYLVKKEINKAKNNAWDKKCAQINSLLGSSRSREAWKCVNSLRKNKKEQYRVDIIGMNKWERYYKTLLTENREEFREQTRENIINEARNGTIEVSREEVKQTLISMKNNKAPGPGGIPIELIKYAPEQAIEIICTIFNKIINGDELPDEWNKSFISSIYKKGNKKECENYRGIAVTSSIGRLYGRIIKKRLEQEIAEIEEQSGFRPGRSCVDNLFTLRQISEKCIARGKELHVIFIDLKKAYDSVPQKKLWEAMEKVGVSGQYIEATRRMYKNATSQVKTRDRLSAPFKTNKGLRQGCPISPTLFKVYLQQALQKWTAKCRNMGIKLNDEHIHTLLFADDQLILAEDEDDASYMVRKLVEEYKEWGLELNLEKTQYMVIGGAAKDLNMEGNTLKHTTQYKYLGVTITQDGRDEVDIRKKIGQGKTIIRQLHPFLWNKNITEKTKKQIYQTIFESCVTYGAETWVMNKNIQDRLLAVEMDFWRRSTSISRIQHIRNEVVREKMHVENTIIDEIERKKLLWYGHMQRMEDSRIPKKAFEWQPMQRRKRGRPRSEWLQGIRSAMENRGLEEEDWRDKRRWRMGCEKRI